MLTTIGSSNDFELHSMLTIALVVKRPLPSGFNLMSLIDAESTG